MKLCTFEHQGFDRVGIILDENNLADITVAYTAYLHSQGETKAYQLANVFTPPSMIGIIEGGKSSLKATVEAMQALKSAPDMKGPKGEQVFYSLSEVKLRAPITRPSKIFGPAVNNKPGYEKLKKPPTEPHPVYCIKLPTCVTGPYDPIEIPDIGVVGSEVEVGAIIAKKGKNIPVERAEEYIFGYTVVNDITAHEMREKQEWIILVRPGGEERMLTFAGRYKCFDTFAPMGPWLVTRDEIPDIHNCNMEARLQGEPVQKGTTADFVFNLPQLISYISGAHTLEPGDIILSGTCTPASGWTTSEIDLRRIGGVLESEVEGIGTLKNPIKPI